MHNVIFGVYYQIVGLFLTTFIFLTPRGWNAFSKPTLYWDEQNMKVVILLSETYRANKILHIYYNDVTFTHDVESEQVLELDTIQDMNIDKTIRYVRCISKYFSASFVWQFWEKHIVPNKVLKGPLFSLSNTRAAMSFCAFFLSHVNETFWHSTFTREWKRWTEFYPGAHDAGGTATKIFS